MDLKTPEKPARAGGRNLLKRIWVEGTSRSAHMCSLERSWGRDGEHTGGFGRELAAPCLRNVTCCSHDFGVQSASYSFFLNFHDC